MVIVNADLKYTEGKCLLTHMPSITFITNETALSSILDHSADVVSNQQLKLAQRQSHLGLGLRSNKEPIEYKLHLDAFHLNGKTEPYHSFKVLYL